MNLDIEFLASQNWDESMVARLRWLQDNDPIHCFRSMEATHKSWANH